MSISFRTRTSAFAWSAFVLCALTGCGARSAGATGSGADLSPAPPTFNAQFEMRNPRVCAKVTHVPSVGEATVMVQCEHEQASRTTGSSPVYLLATDVSVEMGSPKPYNPRMDSALDNIDPSAQVYPLRGSSTGYFCTPANAINRGKNCGKTSGGQVGQGACWHTQFNEWRCFMTIGGKDQELQVKGPVAF